MKVVAAVLGVVLCIVLGGVYLNRTTVGEAFGPSCTVGVTGTAAMVEVKGWGAPAACGALAGQTGLYRYHGSIVAPPICQYSINDNQFTVHDEGALNLVGNTLCHALENQASNGVTANSQPDLAVSTPTPIGSGDSTSFSDMPTPTPTPLPAIAPTDVPTVGDQSTSVVAAVSAYHQAAQAAYGQTHDGSQIDDTMTGTARQAILCIMQNRSDSLMSSGSYFTYQDISDHYGPVSVAGDTATVTEDKHQVLTVHKSDGTMSTQDNTFSVNYTLNNSTGKWLVGDYQYVSSTGFRGNASEDAKPCGG